MYDSLKEGAVKLNPLDYVSEISPRPLLIIHRKKDLNVPVRHAYELERYAGESVKPVVAEERMHSDSDSFFSSGEREDGAIRMTLDWLKKYL